METFDTSKNIQKPTVFIPAKEPLKSITEDLTNFVHSVVALGPKASRAEIETLPKVAEILYKYGDFGSYGIDG